MITSIKALKVGLDFGGKIEPVGRLAIRERTIKSPSQARNSGEPAKRLNR